MSITTTVVASLPRLVRPADWTEGSPSAPAPLPPAVAAVRCRTTTIRVNVERLTAELEAEFRRQFGPSPPPQRRSR